MGILADGQRSLLEDLLGRDLRGVGYEGSGVVESAYLIFDDGVVEVAAVDWIGDWTTDASFPWRLTFGWRPPADVPGDIVAKLVDLGRLEGFRIYANDQGAPVVFAVAFELSGDATLWAWSAGSDFVQTTVGEPPKYVTDARMAEAVRNA